MMCTRVQYYLKPHVIQFHKSSFIQKVQQFSMHENYVIGIFLTWKIVFSYMFLSYVPKHKSKKISQMRVNLIETPNLQTKTVFLVSQNRHHLYHKKILIAKYNSCCYLKFYSFWALLDLLQCACLENVIILLNYQIDGSRGVQKSLP